MYKPAHDRGFGLGATQHEAERHGQYNGPGEESTTVLQRSTNLPLTTNTSTASYVKRDILRGPAFH
jgi:hypothetical protein